MTNKTSPSSDSSPNPDSGATDSLWQPSWWHWLISALSGTIEIEKQTAWLRKNTEDLRKSNEDLRKSNEDLRKSNEEYERKTEEMRKSNEEFRRENERLAELESKIDGLFYKYGIYSPPASKPKQQ
jgi:DNA repair exonuclease SbcCD ATPase subunit